MEIKDDSKELMNFIFYCQSDPEYIDFKSYVNSVSVHFKLTITTDIFKKLNMIKNDYFVYKSVYIGTNSTTECITLFIYKKLEYVFD